jgi:hypothetical protein
MTTSAVAWHPYTTKPGSNGRVVRFNQPAGFTPLKQKYVNSLLNEEVETRDAVHAVCYSIGMSAFACGWTFSYVEKMLSESPALGPSIQRRGVGRLTSIIAQAKADANPADITAYVNDLRVRLAGARTEIQSIRWPRIPGISVDNSATTKVLLAILEIADAAATTEGLHLSVRRVGIMSGTNKSVASRAIKRLAALHVLKHSVESASSQAWHANAYDLHLAAMAQFQSASEGVFDHTLVPFVSHDAFRRGALGPTSLRVLAALPPGTRLEASEVAAQVGLSSGWIKTILTDRLAAYRLVSRHGDFWFRCANDELPMRLDEAAAFGGKAGETARLSAVYAQERELFRYRSVTPNVKIDRETGEVLRATSVAV